MQHLYFYKNNNKKVTSKMVKYVSYAKFILKQEYAIMGIGEIVNYLLFLFVKRK